MTVEERHEARDGYGSPWHAEHLARYRHAVEAGVTGKVLDLASGSGFGSSYLRQHGCEVIAADIDPVAVQKSSMAAATSQASGEQLPFRSESFDSVVSVETVEHVANPSTFLDELRRVLRPGGLLVLTTPNALYSKPVNGVPTNPFHLREYTLEELLAVVGDRFADVEVLAQDIAEHVKVSPFSNDQAAQHGARARVRSLTWRVLHKLPPSIHDQASRRLWGHTLHLRETDYAFSTSLVHRGRVLVLHGRRP